MSAVIPVTTLENRKKNIENRMITCKEGRVGGRVGGMGKKNNRPRREGRKRTMRPRLCMYRYQGTTAHGHGHALCQTPTANAVWRKEKCEDCKKWNRI